MAKTLSFSFDDDLIEQIEEKFAATGKTNRSEFVQMLIRKGLTEYEKKEAIKNGL